MPLLVLLSLILGGCASPASAVEARLNAYAIATARGSDLSGWLTGKALESATASSELVQSLGLVGYGFSRFSNTIRISESSFESCLDVSGTQFRDSSGELISVSRLERQWVEVSLRGALVSNIDLSGVPC